MGEEFIFQAGTPALLVKLYSFHYQPRSFFLFKHAAAGVGWSQGWVSISPGVSSHLCICTSCLRWEHLPIPGHWPMAAAHRLQLPIHITHNKGAGLRSKTQAFTEQHKLLILCFCLWNKVVGIIFGNLLKSESFVGLW